MINPRPGCVNYQFGLDRKVKSIWSRKTDDAVFCCDKLSEIAGSTAEIGSEPVTDQFINQSFRLVNLGIMIDPASNNRRRDIGHFSCRRLCEQKAMARHDEFVRAKIIIQRKMIFDQNGAATAWRGRRTKKSAQRSTNATSPRKDRNQ